MIVFVIKCFIDKAVMCFRDFFFFRKVIYIILLMKWIFQFVKFFNLNGRDKNDLCWKFSTDFWSERFIEIENYFHQFPTFSRFQSNLLCCFHRMIETTLLNANLMELWSTRIWLIECNKESVKSILATFLQWILDTQYCS